MVVERDSVHRRNEQEVVRDGLVITQYWQDGKGLVISVRQGEEELVLNDLLPCGWYISTYRSQPPSYSASADFKKRCVRLPADLLVLDGKQVLDGVDEKTRKSCQPRPFIEVRGSMLVVIHEILHAHIYLAYHDDFERFKALGCTPELIGEWADVRYAHEVEVWDGVRRWWNLLAQEGWNLEPSMDSEEIERFIALCLVTYRAWLFEEHFGGDSS